MEEKFTEKLFFGKFDYKVTIKCSKWNREKSSHIHPAVADYLIKEANIAAKYRVRHSPGYGYGYDSPDFRAYYFSDPAYLAIIQDKLSDSIEEVIRPKNAEHSKALHSERVIVRKKLFHGKYRYCIRTSRKWISGTQKNTTKHMDDMVAWCEVHFKGKTKNEMYIFKGWTTNFFFNNAADVMLFKLTWGDDIDRTDRIMLEHELKSDE